MSYEKSIEQIGDRPGVGIQQWLVRRTVQRFLGSEDSASVLEIGTGVGRVAVEVSRLGHHYLGVEPTSSLRDAAQHRLSALGTTSEIIDSALPDLPGVVGSSFSHAMALHVLEHASSSEAALQWIRGIATKVRPGGRILIVCPNFLDLGGYFYDADWTHGWVSTTSRIVMVGEEAGLKVVDERDLRGTFSNAPMRTLLCLLSWLFPTHLVNWSVFRLFKIRNFGTGIQTALFWRMSWVVFERDVNTGQRP